MSESLIEMGLEKLEKRVDDLQSVGESKFKAMEEIIGGQAVIIDAMSKIIASMSQDLGRQRQALLTLTNPLKLS